MDTGAKTIVVDFLDVQFYYGKSTNIQSTSKEKAASQVANC